MIINPHEAITKMTSEEYHDFMWRARHAERERQQQQAEEDHFTAVGGAKHQSDPVVLRHDGQEERDTPGGATRWMTSSLALAAWKQP